MIDGKKAFGSFSVSDVAQAKQFYGQTLGLEVSDGEMGHLELHLGGDKTVMLYPKETHEPASFTVLNFPVDDIDAAVDELIGRGVRFEQYGGELAGDDKGIVRSPHGPPIAWFKDPAGNIVSVIEQP